MRFVRRAAIGIATVTVMLAVGGCSDDPTSIERGTHGIEPSFSVAVGDPAQLSVDVIGYCYIRHGLVLCFAPGTGPILNSLSGRLFTQVSGGPDYGCAINDIGE